MKKILLSTVFSFVFVMPGWAEEVVVPVDAAAEKVQPVIKETADGVVKVMQEEAAPAYVQEVNACRAGRLISSVTMQMRSACVFWRRRPWASSSTPGR